MSEGEKLNETLRPENHVFVFEENLFPAPAKASSGQMLIQKGFSCSVPTLASFRVSEPGHGLPVTCSGRATH